MIIEQNHYRYLFTGAMKRNVNERESWAYRKAKMMIVTAEKRKYREGLSMRRAGTTSPFVASIVGLEKKN